MKQIINKILFATIFAIFSLSSFGQIPLTGSGTLSFNQLVTIPQTSWLIDIQDAKNVKLTYSTQFSLTGDQLLFMDIDADGSPIAPPISLTGYMSGIYRSSNTTGKVLVILNTNLYGFKNFTIQYAAVQSISTPDNLDVGNNAIISGNLGIGTSYPYTNARVHSETTSTGTFNFLARKNSGAKLDVASIGLGVTSNTVNGGIKGGIFFQRTGDNGVGDLIFALRNSNDIVNVTAADAQLTIKNGGNVGIGIQKPLAGLHVTRFDNSNGSNTVAIFGSDYSHWTNFGGTTGGRIRGDNSGYLVLESNPNGTGADKNLYLNLIAPSNILIARGGGNVGIGIGITTPSAKLEVYNTAKSGHLVLSGNDDQGSDLSRIDLDYCIKPINQTIARISSAYITSVNGGSGALRFFTSNSGALNEKMRIDEKGNVAIGMGLIPAVYMLEVNGIIHAREVKVDVIGFPDFVFDKSYKLMPINQVEQYLKINNHLPEIPSAIEVSKNGMNMGEMQSKLLQKIEELTLYMIEQQKQIDELKKQLEK